MNHKVLLINPNSFQNPPVPPIGLESVAAGLLSGGCDVRILDLCFSPTPEKDIENTLKTFDPTLLGFTVRNIDSVLYPGTECYLPEIKGYIELIKDTTSIPVAIGGSGLMAGPEDVLVATGADFAVSGPASSLLPELLKTHQTDDLKGKIFYGGVKTGASASCKQLIDYSMYIEKGGLAGFLTHTGCSWSCSYCLEAKRQVHYHTAQDVVNELKRKVEESGIKKYHLCDSEFNEKEDYCLEFLRLLKNERLNMKWTLYMRPEDNSPELVELLKATGAWMATISIDTLRFGGKAYRRALGELITLCGENGLRTAIDMLTGFPGEDEEPLKRAIDFLSETPADDVVINSVIRLYRNLPLTRKIKGRSDLMKYVAGDISGSCLEPVFFIKTPHDRVEELIENRENFRVARSADGANYQKG